MILFHRIPKELGIILYERLLGMLTPTSIAGFCEALNISMDVNCHDNIIRD